MSRVLILIVAVLSGCGTYCDNPRSMACMSADQIERELAVQRGEGQNGL